MKSEMVELGMMVCMYLDEKTFPCRVCVCVCVVYMCAHKVLPWSHAQYRGPGQEQLLGLTKAAHMVRNADNVCTHVFRGVRFGGIHAFSYKIHLGKCKVEEDEAEDGLAV